jgi:methionyl-tRNA formyltransferase
MKIVFMGTPAFAVPALSAIASSGHEIKYVITQQDKAKDRGKKLQYTPVKEKALHLGIEVLQPEKLKGNIEAADKIAGCSPDMAVVAAYGKILPADILNIPKYGCINIHASLLPRWRGAAPIQHAIIEGDDMTGVTIMHMAEGLDTGDMILSKGTSIAKKTASELHDELALLGAELIVEAIGQIEKGTAPRIVQDERLATYAPMIFKKDGALDFRKNPEALERLVRGVNPWPGAYTTYKGETMKIWEAFPIDKKNAEQAGTITGISDAGIEVSAGGKTLLVTEIQMPGKKRMKIKEYLKGNKIEKLTVLK